MPTRPRFWPEPPVDHPPMPAWVRAAASADFPNETSFLAGAALAVLHPLARDPHAIGRLWRQRLALACAAAVARQIGRPEDEATLRDQFYLTRLGDDSGPAGRLLQAWRLLAGGRPPHPEAARWLGELLDVPAATMEEVFRAAATCEGEGGPMAAAAGVVAASLNLVPRSPALALWLADAALGRRLQWSAPVPLLAAHIRRAELRLEASERSAACCRAYTRAAIAAVDLHADLRRRARQLLAIAPKLRSKEAENIVAGLLAEDAFLPATAFSQVIRSRGEGRTDDRPRHDAWSERSGRRLFDRLVALGGVRELTGRSTFRLYGL